MLLPRTLMLAVSLWSPSVAAAPGDELFAISADPPGEFQVYGKHIDAEGGLLIVGGEGVALAQLSTGPENIPGRVELRDASTGAFISVVPIAGIGPADTVLVTDVHLAGDHALVGLRNFVDGQPRRDSVEVFSIADPTNPVFVRSLQPAGAFNEAFGEAIDTSGHVALIGAYGSQLAGGLAGAAYLFDYTTGEELASIFPNDAPFLASFGWAVAVSGDTAIISARGFSSSADEPEGSARFYNISDPRNPVFLSKVSPAAGSGPDQYGAEVAIDGDLALVGAFFDDEAVFDGGSVYAYDITDPTNPVLRSRFQSPDPESSGRFGDAIDLVGDTALIGESVGRGFDRATGTAYIYDLTDSAQPIELLEIFPPGGTSNASLFGNAVALVGETAFVGAPQEDVPLDGAGRVFAFDVAFDEPCLADVNMDGEVTPTDFGAWLAAFNAGDPAADQNLDGQVTPTDFGAWLANFNAGCDGE